MGLLDFIGKQFIDVIDWTEEDNGILSYRYPMMDKEIQNGGQLTVRESQLALFVNEGEAADIFSPGLYTLNTKTLPIVTYLQNWDKFFKSPFKSDVFFFSTREQIDQRWGTPNPIIIRDKDYGPLRLRAHGIFSYKIEKIKPFFMKICGTREQYTALELEGQLRAMIITQMASFLGNAEISFVDMAANQTRFSDTLKEALKPAFEEYGLSLETFLVQSISLPEELQSALDKVSSMKVIGDLQKYAQFQAADSISKAAENEGGIAGAGAGLGAGIALGQVMTQALGTGGGPLGSTPTAEDPLKTIEKLHGLMEKGILTKEEFNAKKAELMKRIQ